MRLIILILILGVGSFISQTQPSFISQQTPNVYDNELIVFPLIYHINEFDMIVVQNPVSRTYSNATRVLIEKLSTQTFSEYFISEYDRNLAVSMVYRGRPPTRT